MTPLQILLLSLIQGVTEFLPVSSSAHLALVAPLTGWVDQGLAFDAAVHAGTLAAVVLHLRPELSELARGGATGRDPVQRTLLLGLAIATLPALLAGAFLADWIELWLRNPVLIAVTTIAFGLLLGAADRWGRRARPLQSVGIGTALTIGLAQVLALVPGTSRSGVTITAGLALGLDRASAARYSFLLSIPIIAAAGGWGFLRGLAEGGRFELAQFLAGAVLSGLFAWLTIAAFLAWLQRAGMLPFVVYRVVLGVALLLWFGSEGP